MLFQPAVVSNPVRSKKEINRFVDPYSEFYNDNDGLGSVQRPTKALSGGGQGDDDQPLSTGFMRISMNEQKLKFKSSFVNQAPEGGEKYEKRPRITFEDPPPRGPVAAKKVPSAAQERPKGALKVPKWARPVGPSRSSSYRVDVFDSRNKGGNYRHASPPPPPLSAAGPVINFRGARSNYGSNVPRHVKSANRKNG